MQEARLEYVSSFLKSTKDRGHNPSINVIEEEIVKTDKETAENLRLSEGEEIIRIKRVKAVNGKPLYTELRYIPHKYCPGLVEEKLGDRSLTELARDRYNLKVRFRDIVVIPFTLDSESAALLKTEKGLPSLLVTETLFLADGSPFKWEKRIHKSGLHFTSRAVING